MSDESTEKTVSHKSGHKHHKDRAAEIANTFEWLITAFILAFVFRAFVMEAFRIPTGSMADTLKGAHFRLRCRQCGYEYEHGYNPPKADTIPLNGASLDQTQCPNCGYLPLEGQIVPVANGDRILVLKCIYQFFEPKRWDVIVFKNPLDPQINYIKRLVGLPKETVEIIDGDVYIDGQIARKPPKVQNEQWMPVYDNDYQPIRPGDQSFSQDYPRKWRQRFNTSDSKWQVAAERPTVFKLESEPDETQVMEYDSLDDTDFRATYAYDPVFEYRHLPYCSDLMVRSYVRAEGAQGRIGISLSKYGIRYSGSVDFDGNMVIATGPEEAETVLISRSIGSPAIVEGQTKLIKFANVDHELVLEFGQEKLIHDLGRDVEDAGEIDENVEPGVGIFGAGKLELLHTAVFRDIHYTRYKYAQSHQTGKATEGRPFELEKDQFFVLGDNSPNSQDSRWWERPGTGNSGLQYREGIVPRDYLVGKALFVYWPSGFKPFDRFPFAAIPNVGKMRFIYGGANGYNGSHDGVTTVADGNTPVGAD